jgi:hypothetical protein
MRKLLFMALMVLGIMANAQTIAFTTSNGQATDTVTNTGTDYAQLLTNNKYDLVTITGVFTKISGTLGGTATLQGSNDGTNFESVNTGVMWNASASAAYTVTNTTGSQVNTWHLKGNPFKYYRISWTGTGTMVGSIKGYATLR